MSSLKSAKAKSAAQPSRGAVKVSASTTNSRNSTEGRRFSTSTLQDALEADRRRGVVPSGRAAQAIKSDTSSQKPTFSVSDAAPEFTLHGRLSQHAEILSLVEGALSTLVSKLDSVLVPSSVPCDAGCDDEFPRPVETRLNCVLGESNARLSVIHDRITDLLFRLDSEF